MLDIHKPARYMSLLPDEQNGQELQILHQLPIHPFLKSANLIILLIFCFLLLSLSWVKEKEKTQKIDVTFMLLKDTIKVSFPGVITPVMVAELKGDTITQGDNIFHDDLIKKGKTQKWNRPDYSMAAPISGTITSLDVNERGTQIGISPLNDSNILIGRSLIQSGLIETNSNIEEFRINILVNPTEELVILGKELLKKRLDEQNTILQFKIKEEDVEMANEYLGKLLPCELIIPQQSTSVLSSILNKVTMSMKLPAYER